LSLFSLHSNNNRLTLSALCNKGTYLANSVYSEIKVSIIDYPLWITSNKIIKTVWIFETLKTVKFQTVKQALVERQQYKKATGDTTIYVKGEYRYEQASNSAGGCQV
jgi:hypothetical protein